MKDKNTKNVAVLLLFLIIIYLPFLFSFFQHSTGKKFDAELKGFTDSVQKTDFNIRDFWNSEYQTNFTGELEASLPLRGVFTKLYNTINYTLFHVGNRPIGKDNFIFEPAYIDTELALTTDYDYSIPDNDAKLQEMVDTMQSVQDKLLKFDKHFFLYIAPSKAGLYKDHIPNSYLAMADPSALNAPTALRQKLSCSNVNYLFCSDLASSLDSPAFYSTGIHWSRPYEQLASHQIIQSLSDIAHKTYRNIELQGITSSASPFNRDNDVYDLLNIWNKPDITYYEYDVTTSSPDKYDPLNILIYGDSFATGLRNDILDNIEDDSIIYVNRCDYMQDMSGKAVQLNQDWNNFNWQQYIDCNDFIIVEMVEPEIVNYSYGFISYLDQYLDNYQPASPSSYYMSELDGSASEWDSTFLRGVWAKETGFAWLSPASCIVLANSDITEKGIECQFTIPKNIFKYSDTDTISLTINGVEVFKKDYHSPCSETVTIEASKFPLNVADTYTICINCSSYFNPKERGTSEDNRDLAVRLEYIGGIR